MADLRYASSNRIVVRLTEHAAPFGDHKFSERASFLLGHQIRAYSDVVLQNPGVGPDLLAATPLQVETLDLDRSPRLPAKTNGVWRLSIMVVPAIAARGAWIDLDHEARGAMDSAQQPRPRRHG